MADDAPDALVKAELISIGRMRVPRELLSGYRLSRSTAGPGAGSASMALAWMGEDGREHHVKLAVADHDDPHPGLELKVRSEGTIELRRSDGSLALPEVTLLPIVMHAPDQAFINLDGECVYECAFCTTHLMDPARRKMMDADRWVELVLKAWRRSPFHALAITGVAAPDHEGLMATYEAIIGGVRARIPDIMVGVEPYVNDRRDIERLHRAGANEIKINVQTPDASILVRVCPGWSLERQYHLLGEAVEVFGRGSVTTNIIIGLGETDDQVEEAVETLAAMGVVPTVRVVRVNDLNRTALEAALGHRLEPVSPKRNIRLARVLKETLQRYGLDATSLETMCHRCGCCDLEPGVDV